MKHIVEQLIENKVYPSVCALSRAMGMDRQYIHVYRAKGLSPSYRALINLVCDLQVKGQHTYADAIMQMIQTNNITSF